MRALAVLTIGGLSSAALAGCSRDRPEAPPQQASPADASSSDGSVLDLSDGLPPPDALPPYHPTKPTTVEELLAVQQGTPEDWMLYNLGQGDPSIAYDVHVDDDAIYWVQAAGRLFQGSKDGTTEPVQIGDFYSTLGGAGIRSDETYVYWLDGSILRRWPKAGGEIEAIPLLWEHPAGSGPLFIDDRYVYVAMDGCAAITRYDKQVLDPEEIYITLPSDGPGYGPTTLLLDGEEVFCASWGSIFKVPWWDEPLTTISGEDPSVRLVASENPIWSMVVTDEEVYWVEKPSAGHSISFGAVPRAGGVAERFGPSGVFGNAVSSLVYDEKHHNVFFSPVALPPEENWMDIGVFIASFSTDSHAFSFYAREFATPFLDLDDNYLYWTSSYLVGSVKRMPLDYEPLYVLEK